MKKTGTSIMIILFVLMCFCFSHASELRQNRLIQVYFGVTEKDWDKVTKENRDLINEELYGRLEVTYRGHIRHATNIAQDRNVRREIPDVTFAFANLGDYIAKQIRRPSKLRFELAGEYMNDGNLPVAIDICNNILMTEPRNVEVALLKADMFLKVGMQQEAMDTYLNVEKIDKNNETALYRLGVLYVQLTQYDKAVGYFRRFLKLRPDNQEAKQFIDLYDGKKNTLDKKQVNTTALNHFMTAERLYNAGRYVEAAEAYSMAIDSDPHFYRAYAYLGECLTRQQKYGEAQQVLMYAIQLSPKQPEAYHFLGLAYEKEFNFNRKRDLLEKALANYEKALKNAPSYTVVQEDIERARGRMKEI
jgi:tetratricopeptide (TPR) repeat protein